MNLTYIHLPIIPLHILNRHGLYLLDMAFAVSERVSFFGHDLAPSAIAEIQRIFHMVEASGYTGVVPLIIVRFNFCYYVDYH